MVDFSSQSCQFGGGGGTSGRVPTIDPTIRVQVCPPFPPERRARNSLDPSPCFLSILHHPITTSRPTTEIIHQHRPINDSIDTTSRNLKSLVWTNPWKYPHLFQGNLPTNRPIRMLFFNFVPPPAGHVKHCWAPGESSSTWLAVLPPRDVATRATTNWNRFFLNGWFEAWGVVCDGPLPSWWLSHPFEKYDRQIGSFPQVGV